MFGGAKKKLPLPVPLREARERFRALEKGSAEKLRQWEGLCAAETKMQAHLNSICAGVDAFDPSHVVMEEEDAAFFRELHGQLLRLRSALTVRAVRPLVAMLRYQTNRVSSFHDLDESCSAKLERLREREVKAALLAKRHMDVKAKKHMRSMQKLQDAQSNYNIAELSFVSSVKDAEADLAFEYMLRFCRYTDSLLDAYGKGHELLVSTRKVVREFERLVHSKRCAYLEAKKAKDLRVSRMRELNQSDTGIMNQSEFKTALNSFLAPADPPLYRGESILIRQRHVIYVHNHRFSPGVLFVTQCRLVFLPYLTRAEEEAGGRTPWLRDAPPWDQGGASTKPWFSVPTASIASVDFMGKHLMTVSVKDYTTHLVSFRHCHIKASVFRTVLMPVVWGTRAANATAMAAHSPTRGSRNRASIYDTFCWMHFDHVSRAHPRLRGGWHRPLADYARLHMTGGKRGAEWRLVHNERFQLSPTYPEYFVVPARVGAEQLRQVADFRSKARVPAAVWCRRYAKWTLVTHHSHGVFTRRRRRKPLDSGGPGIFRASQPRVGLSWSRSKADEALMASAGAMCGLRDAKKNIHILDCRPKANALANVAKGGGWESTKYYKNCTFEFLNIENIHVVRESFKELAKLFTDLPIVDQGAPSMSFRASIAVAAAASPSLGATVSGAASTPRGIKRATTPGPMSPQHRPDQGRYDNVLAVLRGGQASWFSHISSILAGANRAVTRIAMDGATVLVHCSDGWDRTPQITALAQLQLDPHYRTADGFAELVAKEWVSFGHKFARRLGHGRKRTKSEDTQRSPIFAQFVDCVFQLLTQFPNSFQFNALFLAQLLEHSTSCVYGNFMYNSESERSAVRLRDRTLSIWLNLCRDPVYRNAAYAQARSGDVDVLLSTSDPSKLELFLPFYARWDQSVRPPAIPVPEDMYMSSISAPRARTEDDFGTPKTRPKRRGITVPPPIDPSNAVAAGCSTAALLPRPASTDPPPGTGGERASSPRSPVHMRSFSLMGDLVRTDEVRRDAKDYSVHRNLLRNEWSMDASDGKLDLMSQTSRSPRRSVASQDRDRALDSVAALQDELNKLKTRLNEFKGDGSTVLITAHWVDSAMRKVRNAVTILDPNPVIVNPRSRDDTATPSVSVRTSTDTLAQPVDMRAGKNVSVSDSVETALKPEGRPSRAERSVSIYSHSSEDGTAVSSAPPLLSTLQLNTRGARSEVSPGEGRLSPIARDSAPQLMSTATTNTTTVTTAVAKPRTWRGSKTLPRLSARGSSRRRDGTFEANTFPKRSIPSLSPTRRSLTPPVPMPSPATPQSLQKGSPTAERGLIADIPSIQDALMRGFDRTADNWTTDHTTKINLDTLLAAPEERPPSANSDHVNVAELPPAPPPPNPGEIAADEAKSLPSPRQHKRTPPPLPAQFRTKPRNSENVDT